MERNLINSNSRTLNELPGHSSLRDFNTTHRSEYSFVNPADKRRADSANTLNNTFSTNVCEEGTELPAVVIKLFSGLNEEQKCGDNMEQMNTDGSQQETKVKKKALVTPERHTAVAKIDGKKSETNGVAIKCCFLPNIELPCTQCGEVVNICFLSSHRSLHNALRKFRYAYEQKPQRLQCLVNRRRRLIKAVQESNLEKNEGNVTDNHILALDTAFQILKADIEGRPQLDEVDVNCALLPKGRGIHLACVMAVGLCVEGNENWKHMEDAHAYHDNFLEGTESSYVGIYDGYFGRTSAQFCAEKLHVFLKAHLDNSFYGENGELNKNNVIAAFKSAFAETEKLLLSKGADERSHHRWSGCSAVTCVLTRTKCYLANLGNVGAILLHSSDVVRVLTRRHDLYDKRERDRVRKSSGVIVKTAKSALINGALGVTRGIGNIGDGALRSCVINEPSIKTVGLDVTDQMIVLASSGLWRTFSYEEVVYLINGFFQQISNEVKKCPVVSKNTSSSTDSTAPVVQKRRNSDGLADHRDKRSEKRDLFKSNNRTCSKISGDQSKRRCSLFSPHEIQLYLKSHGPPQVLSIKDKAYLLAKGISQRLVQSALLAGSKDNITVFVILLPGFCLVNLDTFTPTLLPYLNATVDRPSSSLTDSTCTL